MSTPLWTCDDLILACNGTLFDPSVACTPISGIEIDSRNCSDGDLFVAIAGDNQDGLRSSPVSKEASVSLPKFFLNSIRNTLPSIGCGGGYFGREYAY